MALTTEEHVQKLRELMTILSAVGGLCNGALAINEFGHLCEDFYNRVLEQLQKSYAAYTEHLAGQDSELIEAVNATIKQGRRGWD